MAAKPTGFLSYTRFDDQFYNGEISAFRETLELGVRVASGDAEFEIFQDAEDIGLGQKFADAIAHALDKSMFLLPIVTPLFFNRPWCRDECKRFLAREKALGRSDLILPIYYVTLPQLEKNDATQTDDLLDEIKSREWFDWREYTKIPPADPKYRDMILDLARKIVNAMDRMAAKPLSPAQFDRQMLSATTALASNAESPLAKIRPSSDAPASKSVLWVDDNPDNNVFERSALERYNVKFIMATSTFDAQQWLAHMKFDAIISDMGRRNDTEAGFTLLKEIRDAGDETPYFLYCGARAPGLSRQAAALGANLCTNIYSVLADGVLKALFPDRAAAAAVNAPPQQIPAAPR